MLGKGGFGQVYAHKDIKRGLIAIKKGKGIQNQYNILSKIEHPNIIKVYDFFDDSFTMQILSMDDGWINLKMFLQRYSSPLEGNLGDLILSRRLPELVDAIEYLHNQRIAHRDIKPENIFIQLNHHVRYGIKLIDFGLSCSEKKCEDLKGTFLYSSPEIFELAIDMEIHHKKHVELPIDHVIKSDLWALGLVIYNCVHYGKNPTDFYGIITHSANDFLQFYAGYEGIPGVTSFQKINNHDTKNLKYNIETRAISFLESIEPSLMARLNYKNYLKIDPQKRDIPRIGNHPEQGKYLQIYKQSLLLEKDLEEIFTKLRNKRQEDYKKKTDELSGLRYFWRKNPNWNEFINLECLKFNKPMNDIFLFLIQDERALQVFWNDMMISTRARRDKFLTRLFKKFILRNDSQKFRLPQTNFIKKKYLHSNSVSLKEKL